MFLVAVLCFASLPTGCFSQAQTPGPAYVPLPVDATAHGVRRGIPTELTNAPDWEAPALAIAPDGALVVAATHWVGDEENIEIWTGSEDELTGPQVVFTGSRAFHVKLATGADGVYAVWCGQRGTPSPGTHRRQIFGRRVHPLAEVTVALSDGADWSCSPDASVDRLGVVHVAWESSDGAGSKISARTWSDKGLGPVQTLSTGWLARRPSVATRGEQIAVAWDTLTDEAPRWTPDLSSPTDPNQEVLMRVRSGGVWSDVIPVATEPGIQAAPSLISTPDGWVVVFHASMPGGLVKWWRARRWDGAQLQELASVDPGWMVTPSGEQQGAELPAVAALSDGGLVVVTRTSQGAAVHIAHSKGITPGLDLTRSPWGARGLRASLAVTDGGEVVMARRSRRQITIERLRVQPNGAPTFTPVTVPRPELEPHRRPPHHTLAGRRIVYGDVHMHSAVSDGTGPIDEIYARAWVRGLDFAVLTDHDYIVGSRMIPSEHDEIAWITDVFNARDGFTTLHAYEWTTPSLPRGSGHQIVYFRGPAPRQIYGYRDVAPDTEALNRALATERAFTAPHHTSWTGTDWGHYNADIQRQFELVSVHGLSERPGPQLIDARGQATDGFAVDGLRAGHQFGFIAGSDAHGLLWHHGQGRRRDPWTQGLTGAWVSQNTRSAVFDAMFARATFATSGPPMAITTTLSHEGQLQWSARGTRQLVEVTLVTNGEDVRTEPFTAIEASGVWTLDPAGESHYIRVVQGSDDGLPDLAWSSPLFPSSPARP